MEQELVQEVRKKVQEMVLGGRRRVLGAHKRAWGRSQFHWIPGGRMVRRWSGGAAGGLWRPGGAGGPPSCLEHRVTAREEMERRG